MPDRTQEQLEYLDAKALADQGAPLRVLVMAAMLTDDEDGARLERAFPLLWQETMRRRFDSPDGALPGDQQTAGADDTPKPITALDRDQ